tara:strand:+ start:153 stop:764 length:612 start_codon:yes stop_codon:yes gene_type:complete
MIQDDLIFHGALNPSYRLVLLHGWGANADDLMPLGKSLIQSCKVELDLVSLSAPHPHPSGMGRQWYGLFPEDWSAVPTAVDHLHSRLRSLPNPKLPLSKTFLFGFSQGGAMAINVGCELPLRGLIACSAYPHPKWIVPKVIPPTFLFHGKQDQIVPCSASDKIYEMLSQNKINKVEKNQFDGDHEIPINVLENIKKIINLWAS